MRSVMAAVAVFTCPCHLPILLAVLAGSTLGVVQEYMVLSVLALTALFVASAWTALQLFSRDDAAQGAR